MAEIKYTSDGKKVVVLGNLNSTEKIVQEIYVVDGSEIPSGEHFVAKTLHDAPAVSWKEKTLNELEQRYEKQKRELENAIEEQEKRLANRRRELEAHLQYAGKMLKEVDEESFEMLLALLTGQIKYVVYPCSYSPQIMEFDKTVWSYGEKQFRLLSIFGRDSGGLDYRVNTWSDGSGSNTALIPCRTHDDAVRVLREVILRKKNLCDKDFELAKEYGFELPADMVNKYKEAQKEQLQRQLNECAERQNDILSKISKL